MSTRFYLESTGTPGITPAVSGSWDSTSAGFLAAPMNTTPAASAMATLSHNDSDNDQHDYVIYQGVSGPLAAQTIAAQTIEIQVRASEPGGANNTFLAFILRVIASDGSTVRGTLLAITVDDNEVATTTLTNRRFTATTTEVIAQATDRIVLEIGGSGNPTLNGLDLSLRVGSANASDLPENDTATTDNNPWLEFPNDVTAYSPPTGTITASLRPLSFVGSMDHAGGETETSIAASLRPLSFAGAAAQEHIAAIAASLRPLTFAGLGDMEPRGTIAASLQPMRFVGSAAQKYLAAIAASLRPLTFSGAAAQEYIATIAAALQPMRFAGVGDMEPSVTIAASLRPLTFSGAAAQEYIAAIAASLQPLMFAATGTHGVFTVAIAASLRPLTFAAVADMEPTGAIAASLQPLTFAGAILHVEPITVAITATLQPLFFAATGVVAVVHRSPRLIPAGTVGRPGAPRPGTAPRLTRPGAGAVRRAP